MGQLLAIEWMKLKNYRAFWILLSLYIATIFGANYIIYRIQLVIYAEKQAKGIANMILGNPPYSFPTVWQSVAHVSSWLLFIPGLIMILAVTNEYSYKTHRQNIIDGWSRNQFMTAKMIDVLIISLLTTAMYFLVALVIGYVNIKDGNGHVWEQTRYIALFFLQTFSQLSLAFLIAFLARKAFIALGIFLFYKIILEKIMVGLSAWKLNDIGRFLPFEISNRMIPVPAFFGRFDEEAYSTSLGRVNEHILYTVLLLALTWGICFRINKRRDL